MSPPPSAPPSDLPSQQPPPLTSDLTVVNFMMISIGVLFVSTVSVSLYAVPKILYHRGILAQPRRVDPNTQVTMANEGHPGASAVGGDMAAEEMADLRSELSEMRNTNQELREAKMELQVELRQYRADDRVRERDLNQLLLLSSVSPWSCASPVAIPSRADPAVMSNGGAKADGSSGHAYGMFNTWAHCTPDDRLSLRPAPQGMVVYRQEQYVQLLNLHVFCFYSGYIYGFEVLCVCLFGRAQRNAVFQDARGTLL